MPVTRQSFRDNRSEVAAAVGDRALSARSVLASALLGADEPRLTAAELVAVASLFGISGGAARTCLWRMVSSGELTSDDGTYALAGHLLERRERVDDAARIPDVATRGWDGTWELAVVSAERRPPAERLELRKAATALHLAELREGVWMRPDNLDPQRLPTMRSVLDRQCVHFHKAASTIADDTVRSLFSLDDWASQAKRLAGAMRAELDGPALHHDDTSASFRFQFALSIAVVRHLQLDPLLPPHFISDDWPGNRLRDTYRIFDEAFKRRMHNAFRRAP
ncbi:PaaX family transcriptional regulator C-terminal domain-containing protein [Mycobacterium sp. IS-1264]|uniref:PaaX family transcriptional regulator C-terminal domain-containing protein n=1 Tax=Mycobacterium sp. IS-1264 TaxID=1834158 RepID=UPI00096FEDE9|nr:PaaX family transcriptional regulator C-terminal domain-containing protein [Mycobacterium sp. IS-1264]OMC42439.1 transcriptional regulator [Mycobacterium sp. IS-1264]